MSVNDTGAECRECGSYNCSYLCVECVGELFKETKQLILEYYAAPTQHRDDFFRAYEKLKLKWLNE